MKKLIPASLLVAGLALGAVWLRREPAERPLPFYLADVEALRRLPFEDVLRMRDNILEAAARQPDRVTIESAPADAERVATAPWMPGARPASGRLVLLRSADGSWIARLEELRVANAPGLALYVSASAPAADGRFEPASAVRAGELKGNAGSENFTLPADLEVSELKSATVWSDLFRMVFARAELQAEGPGR